MLNNTLGQNYYYSKYKKSLLSQIIQILLLQRYLQKSLQLQLFKRHAKIRKLIPHLECQAQWLLGLGVECFPASVSNISCSITAIQTKTVFLKNVVG